MHDNEASDTICDVEQDISDSLRLATFSSSTSPREDNTRDNDHQPTLPLGVELTGYGLFTTSVILGFGIPKAVYSYKGQAMISTTLDWLGGTILALILFWLGVIDAKRPELSPLFFQVDLAPSILKFLCRPEVHIWFLSTLPLLLSTTYLRAMLDARRNHEHASNIPTYVIKDGLTLSMLSFSASTCVFCLECVGVIWPRVFRGTRRHTPLFVTLSVWGTYNAYAGMQVVRHIKDHPTFIIQVAGPNIVWLYPTLPALRHFIDTRKGYFPPLRLKELMVAACFVLGEAVLIEVWGFPDFPAAYNRARSVGNKAWTLVLSIGRGV